MATAKTITVRCKAFSAEGVRENRVRFAADGTVSVYDSVAGHYTIHHALSAQKIARLRKLATI